ncbi:hypothetical protein ACHHYP_01985 [Achlya hypogyna]|uniref:FUZ/MON1/HPS1 first Longin domain-containing protein n=1 Tax=Achlya hypogyna TaxID=1202772 RepID=A0A1V9Z7R4_ACHHY|nr:hypothetical protein ACHHYP_01985 [Achlya hypogyna]
MAEDGLLVIVNGIGIPVLVRSYGDALEPPTAAIGVVCALFHATLDAHKTLAAVAATDCAIAYRSLPSGILLAFFHRRDAGGMALLLQWLERGLSLLLGPILEQADDTCTLKFELSRAHVLDTLDWLITERSSAALSLGLPVASPGTPVVLAGIVPWAGAMYLVLDGVVVGDHGGSSSSLRSHEMVLCVGLASRFAKQTRDRHMQLTIHVNGASAQLLLAKSATDAALVWWGIGTDALSAATVQASVLRRPSAPHSYASLVRAPWGPE